MPDLSLIAVHTFWHDYDRRTLYRILTSMESLESWVQDEDPGVNAKFAELGVLLDKVQKAEFKNEVQLVKVLANTHSSRAVRLMQFLDTLKPGTASKLLVFAEDQTKDGNNNPYAELFLKRNMVFEKMQLLGRVFSQERINLVLRALENVNE